MSDQDLLVLIQQHEQTSIGNPSNASGVSLGTTTPSGTLSDLTTVEIDRYNALNYYNGRPFGNEQDDRSQVVLPIVRDTTEWIIPQLLRMYAGTSRICQFDPEHPGDEQQAEQETDACNWVFWKQNPGFHILHDAFKDALLLKNYYLKAYWDKQKHVSVENYSGLTEDELALLQMDAKQKGDVLEFLEQNESQQITEQGPVSVFAVKLRRTTTKGRVKVDCVPPEEMRVSVRTKTDMEESPFIAHVTRPTRSDLLEMGYDKDIVESIPAARPLWTEMDQLARDTSTDEQADQNQNDPSTVEVELKECYFRVDYDGDGIAELRRIMVAGNKILDNEEVAEHPFAFGVPIRMSHRHLGVSLYDITADLQQIGSMLFRQYMDNTYQINNTRYAVDQDYVNFDDLLTNRPGGIVRTKGMPGERIMPLTTNNVGTEIMPALEFVDKLRTMRTGIGETTLGLDPDALQDVSAAAILSNQSSATLLLENMARNLGEGLRTLFLKIHGLLIRHQDQPLMAQIAGNWVPVNPAEWRNRTSVTLNIGLGSGNRQELRQNAMFIAQAQQQAAQAGLVGPQQFYNTAVKIIESLGWENGQNQYFLDPESAEFKQLAQQRAQQPNPQVQVAQAKAQADMQANAQQHQQEMQRIQANAQAQTSKDLFNARVNEGTATAKAQLDAEQQQLKTAGDVHVAMTKAQLDAVAEVISAALKAMATPQQIEADTQAAERSLG